MGESAELQLSFPLPPEIAGAGKTRRGQCERVVENGGDLAGIPQFDVGKLAGIEPAWRLAVEVYGNAGSGHRRSRTAREGGEVLVARKHRTGISTRSGLTGGELRQQQHSINQPNEANSPEVYAPGCFFSLARPLVRRAIWRKGLSKDIPRLPALASAFSRVSLVRADERWLEFVRDRFV